MTPNGYESVRMAIHPSMRINPRPEERDNIRFVSISPPPEVEMPGAWYIHVLNDLVSVGLLEDNRDRKLESTVPNFAFRQIVDREILLEDLNAQPTSELPNTAIPIRLSENS